MNYQELKESIGEMRKYYDKRSVEEIDASKKARSEFGQALHRGYAQAFSSVSENLKRLYEEA